MKCLGGLMTSGALFVFLVAPASANPGVTEVRLSLESRTAQGGQALKGRAAIARATGVTPQNVTLILATANPSLIRFVLTEINIPAAQNEVTFEFGTASVLVPTTVGIAASVAGSNTLRASSDLALVPALINKVTLSTPSMIGTRGTTLQATAELKAPAPSGGIQLYLSPLIVSPSFRAKEGEQPPFANPMVPAGSRSVVFPLRYDDLIEVFASLNPTAREHANGFESQNRRIEIIVALDPQSSKVWTTIPDRAVKAGFDLVPLRITSITVQPSTIPQSTEAVGTFTLSAAPGSGERISLGAIQVGKVVATGSSCSSPPPPGGEITLATGATSQTFKVCAPAVSTQTSGSVRAYMRSGEYSGNFTVRP